MTNARSAESESGVTPAGIGRDTGADRIERVDRRAVPVGRRLEHERRNRSHRHQFGDARRAMTADVAGDLATAGGMAVPGPSTSSTPRAGG